ISKIKVSPWNGGLDEADSADAGAQDSIVAANHGSLSGKLKSISNGKLGFNSSGDDLELQTGDVWGIRVSTADAAQAKAAENEVLATLLVPARVTMEIESWNEKGVTVNSPDFGKAVFSPDVFKFMYFKLEGWPPGGAANMIDTDDSGAD